MLLRLAAILAICSGNISPGPSGPAQATTAIADALNATDPAPVDCVVSYTEWTECHRPCSGDMQFRTGTIVDPAENDGRPCPSEEELQDQRQCDTIPGCAAPEGSSREKRDVPNVNCEVEYSNYTDCSEPCGVGVKYRTGKIVKAQSGNGLPCEPLEQAQLCNEHACENDTSNSRPKRGSGYPTGPARVPKFPKFPKAPPKFYKPIYLVIDCTKLPDGNYPHPSKKCFSKYYTCSNGEGSERSCPTKMFYHKRKDECDVYAYVPACSGKDRPSTTTAHPQLPTSTQKPDYNCANRKDGDYPDPRSRCSQRWFYCLGGHATKRVCPNKLFYDPKSKKCKPWRAVYRCSGSYLRSTTKVPSDFATRPPVPIACGNLPDGRYPDPAKKCSNVFYVCTHGDGIKRTCPGETKFNPKLGTCDAFGNVFVCSGRRVTTPAPTTTKKPKVYPFKCKNIDDGFYPAGRCKPYYWACSGGITSKTQCGKTLYYDVELKICQNRRNIPKCGGRRPTTPLMLPTTTRKSPVVDYDCSRKPDGNFEAGKCVKYYYSCSGAIARKMDCAPSTFYDYEMDQCNIRKYIPKCGGRRPVTTTPANRAPTKKRNYGRRITRKTKPTTPTTTPTTTRKVADRFPSRRYGSFRRYPS